MPNDKLVAFRCPTDMLEALDWIAAEMQCSRSDLIRIVVDGYLAFGIAGPT